MSEGLAMPIGLHAAINVAQWVMGEKTAPGFFALSLDPVRAGTAAAIPWIAAAVPLIVAAALWRWYPRTARPA